MDAGDNIVQFSIGTHDNENFISIVLRGVLGVLVCVVGLATMIGATLLVARQLALASVPLAAIIPIGVVTWLATIYVYVVIVGNEPLWRVLRWPIVVIALLVQIVASLGGAALFVYGGVTEYASDPRNVGFVLLGEIGILSGFLWQAIRDGLNLRFGKRIEWPHLLKLATAMVATVFAVFSIWGPAWAAAGNASGYGFIIPLALGGYMVLILWIKAE